MPTPPEYPANVVTDFPGGKVEVMATFTDSNITGFARIGEDWVVVGMFRQQDSELKVTIWRLQNPWLLKKFVNIRLKDWV